MPPFLNIKQGESVVLILDTQYNKFLSLFMNIFISGGFINVSILQLVKRIVRKTKI